MRLDTSYLAYLTKDELRVLVAVEMGMKNHEYVPVSLIEKISKVKRANAYQILQNLLKNKLLEHVSKQYDGYRMTYLGYDFLALSVFYKRGSVTQVLQKVGVGKESDIYQCKNANGDYVILKLARLGRTSFRTVKKNRDYLKHRTHYSWLYLSRLASIKEFAFMDACYKNKFPTPKPIDWNRHAIVMSLVPGYTLCKVQELGDVEGVFKQCIDLIERFAQYGLIHSDFNEFNLMITEQQQIIVIDFPQMVSTQHPNAEFYFNRDLECVNTFFQRRFKSEYHSELQLKDIAVVQRLDNEVKASGFIKKELDRQQDLDVLDEIRKEEEGEAGEEGAQSSGSAESEVEQAEQEENGDENESKDGAEVSGEELIGSDREQQNARLDSDSESEHSKEAMEAEEEEREPEESGEHEKERRKKKREKPKQQQVQLPQPEIQKLDQEYIKKFLKKKYRKKMVIHKNINKNKEIDFEERISDLHL